MSVLRTRLLSPGLLRSLRSGTLFCLILASTGSFLSAQQNTGVPDNFCATIQPEESLTWLRAWQAAHSEELVSFRRSAEDILIPLKVHIVGTDEGTGYYRLDLLMEALCDVNVQFDSTGFHFYLLGNINYIDDDRYYAHDYFSGSQMMLENNIQQAVNMYFVSDPAGACGYYTWGPDAIAIAKSCAADGNSTIAHELGHFFSLPHTFSGWEGGTPPPSNREKVDRSNCNTAGDGFCGTGPDYAAYRWNCPLTGPFTDPNGEEFIPDGTFYMSYSNDGCTTRFSDDQKEAMNDFLVGPRDELLIRVPPPTLTHEPVEAVEPEDGTLNTTYNYTVLKWRKDPNATHYLVSVGLNATMSAITREALVTDTFYIVPELTKLRKHYWRVKPISPANTCTPFSQTRTFTTGEVPSGLWSPSFAGNSLQVNPNPVQSGAELFTAIETELAGEVQLVLSGLDGRVYWNQQQWSTAGETRLAWRVPVDLPAGIYLLNMEQSDLSGKVTRWNTRIAVIRP